MVYVLAVQNSGSTVLDALIGSAPACRGLGEVAGFGRIADGQPCDCGRADPWCEPCTDAVAAIELASGSSAWAQQLSAVMGGGRLWWTVLPTAGRRRYAQLSAVAMCSAARATGSSVVVDSSKNVARAAALLTSRELDVWIVHLVRDPRGYLASRARRAGRHDRAERRPTLLTHWLLKNILAATVIRVRARGRYLRVHWEDLLENPAPELARLGDALGLDLRGAAEQAMGPGLSRAHLYEPRREVDYSVIRLDRDRGSAERDATAWRHGGFVGAVFGYRRDGRRR